MEQQEAACMVAFAASQVSEFFGNLILKSYNQYTFIYFSLKGGSERIKYNNLFHYELIK